MDLVLIYLSCGNEIEASKISKNLLDKKLIACAKKTVIGSSYWWKGSIDNSEEVLLMMETFSDKFEAIEAEVKKIHSYEQIVMVAVPIIKSAKGVSEWVTENTNNV